MREGKPTKPAGGTKVTLRSRLAVSRTGCAVSPTKSRPEAYRVRATCSPRKKSKTQDAAEGTGRETAEPAPPRMDGAEPKHFAGWMVSRFFFWVQVLCIALIFMHLCPFLCICAHLLGAPPMDVSGAILARRLLRQFFRRISGLMGA